MLCCNECSDETECLYGPAPKEEVMEPLPLPDGVNHVVTLAEYARVGGELDAARAERDRLATENAELKSSLDYSASMQEHFQKSVLAVDSSARHIASRLAATHATLDALREVVPEDDLDFDEMYPERDFDDLESAIRAILYPKKETDNG